MRRDVLLSMGILPRPCDEDDAHFRDVSCFCILDPDSDQTHYGRRRGASPASRMRRQSYAQIETGDIESENEDK